MRRTTWIATLAVGLVVIAGTAAAATPKGKSGAPAAPHGQSMGERPGGMAPGGPGMGPGGPGMGACGPGMGACGPGMGRGMCCGMRCEMDRRDAGMRRGRGPGPDWMGKLDLTKAQREKVADIRERTMKENIRARADLRVAQIDLGKLLRADHPDRPAIEAQIDRMAGQRAAIQKARVAALLDGRALLTTDQLIKARELRKEGGMRLRGGRGMGGPDGPGDPPGDEME